MDRQVAATALLLAACGSGDPVPDAACQPAVLYLNRTGGAWDHGAHDDSTLNLSILVDAPRTLAPWPKDSTDWGLLVDCIRAGPAPFPVTITETDPGAAAHTEIVFTTAYWAGSAGTTSIIPDSCRPDHEVMFVFGNALATRARACHVALRSYAQMIAGLSFGDRCEDLLNDQMDCVPDRTFVNASATCVDANDQPIACRCGGTTQNSFEAMTKVIPTC
jgi:hypothetical protein